VIQVAGQGAWSVALVMAAAAAGTKGWVAEVGVEGLGLAAAAELGLDLKRLLLVEPPPSSKMVKVVSSLLEAVAVILLPPPSPTMGPIPHAAARRLKTQAREKGAIVFALTAISPLGTPPVPTPRSPSSPSRSQYSNHSVSLWPDLPDITIHTTNASWDGIGQGHGRLTQRRLDLHAQGRRASARPRTVSVFLPDPNGQISAAPTSSTPIPAATPRPQEAVAPLQ